MTVRQLDADTPWKPSRTDGRPGLWRRVYRGYVLHVDLKPRGGEHEAWAERLYAETSESFVFFSRPSFGQAKHELEVYVREQTP